MSPMDHRERQRLRARTTNIINQASDQRLRLARLTARLEALEQTLAATPEPQRSATLAVLRENLDHFVDVREQGQQVAAAAHSLLAEEPCHVGQ